MQQAGKSGGAAMATARPDMQQLAQKQAEDEALDGIQKILEEQNQNHVRGSSL